MMKMLEKTGTFLLVTVMLMSILTPLSAMAATSGTCGDNLTWVLDDSGTLTISGTGDMWDWESNSDPWGSNSAPWGSVKTPVKRVVINSGVTSIGDRAFRYCGRLTSVAIPDSVTSIGDYAFYACYELTSVTIPDSVTSIEEGAFNGCGSLTSVTIPDSVTSIEEDAFSGCGSLTSIFVDSGNTKYSNDEYGILFNKSKTELIAYPSGRSEKTYTIPDSVTSIGDRAFSSSHNFTTVIIPDSVTSIGIEAFMFCEGLTSITIPGSVTSIGEYAFYDSRYLTTVTICNGVTSIKEGAFSRCESLTSVTIPDSMTSIGDNVFEFSGTLRDIYYEGSEAEWNNIAGIEIPSGATVHYNAVLADTEIVAVAPGTIIGSALRTNITAEINGHAIPSFNVDGYTYIVAEDLKDYGFSVYYDNATRTLALSRDTAKTDITRSYVKPYVAPGEVGIKEHNIVATDIVTYIDNNYTQSYNINGQTIIKFDELGRYGVVSFDDSTRIISVTIPGLN